MAQGRAQFCRKPALPERTNSFYWRDDTMQLHSALRRGSRKNPTFAGPRATGRWMGIQNAVGNVAGMTVPVVTGYLVESTGNYTAASIVSGAALG
jgi:nitrate/nitrite transporter NarK